ncbi:hypothetical protein BP5796_08577 [Coleophoma crateriformis]|uniref:Xylanolytic transcriptional activator regulatory domain-containing protein n=1 Tax=Coleophoma crateriformis TaxID=565419 RepID=A0A3D8R8A7_9HELO|nr:hypothetical protein BP5796_08577 [Coleophoma crateriformis]
MTTRIQQLEAIIKAAVASAQSSQDADVVGPKIIERQMELSDSLSMMIINDRGASQFVGSSSGFSLFSPRGLQWIAEKTGTTNLDKLLKQVLQLDPGTWDRGSWSGFTNLSWYPIPPSQREPAPEKAVADKYVEMFFFNFNAIFPIFNRASFDERLEQQYSDNPPQETAWYASFNSVLAIGCQMYRMSLLESQAPSPFQSRVDHDLEQEAARYCRNSAGTFHDLQFGSATLLSVQAMVAMVFITFHSNHLLLPIIMSAAARLGHSIGLHRSLGEAEISADQVEERKSLFWTIYTIDKDISLQSGSPPIIHDQDIGVALPEENPQIVRYPSGKIRLDTFLISAKLAMIESRIYMELYSTRSRTRSAKQRMKSISTIDADLQKWKDSIPIEIRPEHEIQCDEAQLVPVMVFHFKYYNCLITMHRASMRHGPWNEESVDLELDCVDKDLNPRVYKSEAICVDAARNVLDLLDYFDEEKGPPFVWPIVSQPLCAALILFVNILQHPADPYASSDLGRINLVVAMVGQWVVQARLYFASGTLWLFYELYKIADLLLTKTKEDQFQEATELAERQSLSGENNPGSSGHRSYAPSFASLQTMSEQKPLPPLPPLSYFPSNMTPQSTTTPQLTSHGSVSVPPESVEATPYSQDRIDFDEDGPIVLESHNDAALYESWFPPMDVQWDPSMEKGPRSNHVYQNGMG